MATTPKETTLAKKFANLENEVKEAWLSGDEQRIAQVQKVALAAKKRASEIVTLWDKGFDGKDMFGADAFPNLIRCRKLSENVGRPKKEKAPDTTLDF